LIGYLISDRLTVFVLNLLFLLIIMEDCKLNAQSVVKLYRWLDANQVFTWHTQTVDQWLT